MWFAGFVKDGPLADRYGKRQVINLATVFFTVGTALSAPGFNLIDLALYRALTGIFAASVMPISLALIGDVVPLKERQAALGTFMGISFLGQGLSMAIGGTVAYFLSWRGVFAEGRRPCPPFSIRSSWVYFWLFWAGRPR